MHIYLTFNVCHHLGIPKRVTAVETYTRLSLISDGASRCQVLVLTSQEDEQIAAIPGLCSPSDAPLCGLPHRRRQRLCIAFLSEKVIPMLTLLEKS